MDTDKKKVHDFWNEASCGETLYLKGNSKEDFKKEMDVRYELEPYILKFAEFEKHKGKKVLEIGVGLGSDHQKLAESGAILNGVDLTERAISYTNQRLQLFGLSTKLQVADAENLPFEDKSFDLVYSWGVLHHSPNTPKAIDEVFRVLKPGGEARIMIYHKYSFVGYMLWIRYAFLKMKLFTSLEEIYDKYLESPGTKAYSIDGAKKLFTKFNNVEIDTVLTHGDTLTSSAGQRHKGILLTIAKLIWPSCIIKTFFPKHGLFMLIKVVKG